MKTTALLQTACLQAEAHRPAFFLILLLRVMLHGTEYSFGKLELAVLAVSPPSCLRMPCLLIGKAV